MIGHIGQAVSIPFTLLDAGGAVLSGEVDGDFVDELTADGVDSGVAVTIAEVGTTGVYRATFTPTSAGLWYLRVRHTATGHTYDQWVEVSLDAQVHTAIVDDGTTVHLRAWLTRNGRQVTAPTSASMTLVDEANTTLASFADASPDANGYFVATAVVGGGVTNNRTYGVVASIVDGGTTYTNARGAIAVSTV